MSNITRSAQLALMLISGFIITTPTFAASFMCTPTEVAVFKSRIHTRCSSAAKDGTTNIWFWAVSTSDAQHANRFLSTASSALISGRKILFAYNSGDTSGKSFGCLAKDCRVPWAITMR